MNQHKFIETAPLYTQISLENYRPPDSITRACSRCKKETTWLKNGMLKGSFKDLTPDIRFEAVAYICGLCKENSLVVFYELLNWSKHPTSETFWHHTAVRKIGQIPAQEIEISPELSGRLGASAGHYKKALICRNQNYGIAAMAYLRRLVDEKTDELIDVMAELARTFGVAEESINKLLTAKRQVQYEEKLRIAAELIPEALRPGGVNPLGQLYKHTSVGLHGKSDDECVAIFDDLKDDFEYVFRNLHLQAEERREFAKRVQERAGRAV